MRRLFTLPNATAVAAAGSVAAALARDALSGADDGRAATSETVAEAGPGVFAHQVAAMNTAVTDNFLNLLKGTLESRISYMYSIEFNICHLCFCFFI